MSGLCPPSEGRRGWLTGVMGFGQRKHLDQATKTFGPGNQATKTFGPGNQATKSPLTFTIDACPAQICWQLYTSIPETVKDIFTSCKSKLDFCGDMKTFDFTWNAFFRHRAQSSEFRRVPNFTNIWSHEGMKSLLIKRPHDWLTNAGTWKLQIRYSARGAS